MIRAWTMTCAAATIALAVTAAPRQAEACGGTFCDAGPQSMPVDQEGENILFVLDEGHVEAHIQIQYDGDPEQFAWIVPVMATPEIEVGSQPLFDNLLAATVPTFQLQTQSSDNCFSDDRPGLGLGCGAMAAFAPAGGGDDSDWGNEGEPEVVVRATVGAYEYAVLDGGTVDGISQWLDDNGYARDDEAPPILQEYLDDGFMFVAFKLQAGTGVDEIHPVVVRYEGDEPCVPLRLTRIAAKEDMGVRVFFLGESRVVPRNYRHVEINPYQIDWVGLGRNYEEVVSLAVDEEGSDGRGFVTEYAGTSSVVSTVGIHSEQWSGAAFAEIDPPALSDVLMAQGLLACEDFDGCSFTHPQIQGLLEAFLPPPPGESSPEFYECTSCSLGSLEEVEWDLPGFAAAVEERIVGPAELALDRLEQPYLTRLYTTISPGEMTSDPLFHVNPGLPDVSNQWTATRIIDCEGPDRLLLPDGGELMADDDDVFPRLEGMPFARQIEEIAMAGAPVVLVDHVEAIDQEVDRWNDDHQPANDAGCDCKASRRRLDGAGPMLMMLLLGLRARRRRSRGG